MATAQINAPSKPTLTTKTAPEVIDPTITFAEDDSSTPSSPSSTSSHIPSSWDYTAHLRHSPHHLIMSPYTTLPHLLDLTSIDRRYALLAKALTIMKPLTRSYATTVYKDAFNWGEVVRYLRHLNETESTSGSDSGFDSGSEKEGEGGKENEKGRVVVKEEDRLRDVETWKYYVIVFRSQIKPGTERPYLGLLDEGAHVEAVEAGGLLKYWFGVPDAEGRNLATCLWRHRDDAKKGGAGPGHRRAMREVQGFYTEWAVERLKLVVSNGAREWDIVKWEDSD